GYMDRPLSFLMGDEDTITSGTDWIPLLTGTPSYVPSAVSVIYGLPVATRLLGRRCQASGYYTAAILGRATGSVADAAMERLVPPHRPGGWPPTSPPLHVPNDGTEAAHDHALARGASVAPPVSPTDRLELDAGCGIGGR